MVTSKRTLSPTHWDTDWYHFDVPVEGSYTITVNGLSELIFGFVDDGGCSSPSFIASATSTPGVSSMVTTVLQPGTYSVFVALTVYDGIPCGSPANNYTVSLN
ncbi:MAG: hypothetical protein DRJ61_10745 [Acidobacteria bacterium]|nr:MAG: hypothetical protein DRJ61_10745 [Acidobacteriota bacterium]